MLAISSVAGALVQIILLIVVAGVGIVGGIGALLSRSRGGTLAGGFVRSVIVPPWPLGWLWVLWSTRASKRRDANRFTPPGSGPAGTGRLHEPPEGGSDATGHVF